MLAADYAYFDAPFLAFAHRGGARYGPNVGRENTLHAFDQAVALGYRYLETDVHASADGVLMAFHDDRLDRVTDHQGMIADLTAAQIADARIDGRDRVPTLSQLFGRYPQARFNVDAKAESAVALLAATIAEHDAYDRVCVSSFDVKRLVRLRRLLGPRVASAASMRGIALNRWAPALTRLINTPAPALQIPLRQVIRGRDVSILTPSLIKAVHRAGKQVHVWTIDDSETMERLIDAGVDGIFTDCLDTLTDVLEPRGLWT